MSLSLSQQFLTRNWSGLLLMATDIPLSTSSHSMYTKARQTNGKFIATTLSYWSGMKILKVTKIIPISELWYWNVNLTQGTITINVCSKCENYVSSALWVTPSELGLYFLHPLADADIHAERRRCTAAASVFQRKLRRAWKSKQASVFVCASLLQNDVLALGDLGAISWLAGMPALVYAGLESSTWLNSADVCARLHLHTLACAGSRLRQKYKQLRWVTLNATACVH